MDTPDRMTEMKKPNMETKSSIHWDKLLGKRTGSWAKMTMTRGGEMWVCYQAGFLMFFEIMKLNFREEGAYQHLTNAYHRCPLWTLTRFAQPGGRGRQRNCDHVHTHFEQVSWVIIILPLSSHPTMVEKNSCLKSCPTDRHSLHQPGACSTSSSPPRH